HSVRGAQTGGAPSISRNWAVVFVTGNGSSGTGTPSAVHSGSQPSVACHTTRRFGSISAFTRSLLALNAAIIESWSPQLPMKRLVISAVTMSAHGSSPRGFLNASSSGIAMVFCTLRNHASGSRTDRITGASGNAALSSGQNAADGQSHVATYP